MVVVVGVRFGVGESGVHITPSSPTSVVQRDWLLSFSRFAEHVVEETPPHTN